jgi:hypothetical protein
MSSLNYARVDQRLSDVYGKSFGWRMFDNLYLTEPVRDFLSREKDIFLNLLDRQAYHTVIEVGAGYGRYGPSVMGRGIDYTGIDLITWLLEIGEWYAEKSGVTNKTQGEYSLRNMSVVDIADLFTQPAQAKKNLVFFPFNCVGNLEYIAKVLEELRELDLDFACSVFNNTSSTGAARADYYAKCGLSSLSATTLPTTCYEIKSAEGFESVGYNPLFLEQLFRKHGYEMVSSDAIGEMGQLVHFRKINDLPKSAIREARPDISKYGALTIEEVAACVADQKVEAVYYLDWAQVTSDIGYESTGLMPFSVVTSSDWQAALETLADKTKAEIAPICVIESSSQDGKKRFYYPVRF